MDTPWILVVEDDALDRSLIRQSLTHFEPDYALVELASPAPVSDLVANKLGPSVAILDQHLLGMSGPEMIRLFRESPGWERVPVVLISNGEPGPLPERVHFLFKPMDPEEFIEYLREAVKQLLP